VALPLLASAILPVAASARQDPADGDLTPRLAELAKPALQDVSPIRQARAVGLAAEGPGSLMRRGGRILVEARFAQGGTLATHRAALRATGAEVVGASARYRTISLAVKPDGLRALSSVPGLRSASEVLAPVTAASCGSVTSEGDGQLLAAAAREDFGVDGSGEKVGILSDSFDNSTEAATRASQDVLSGDLPGAGNPCGRQTPVEVVDDSFAGPEATDEGRGMAQIVNDIAPGAAISFATAFFKDQTSFARNIRELAADGATVIVDDVSYFEEPFFQEGPIAVAVDETAAEGIPYFTAAGNDNLFDPSGDPIASWEAPEFRDTSSCPAALEAEGAEDCMDFDPGPGQDRTFGITVEPESTLTVDLQWAEPWGGVGSDIDAYLLDEGGAPLAADGGTRNNPGKTQRPVEVLQWENTSKSESKVVQLAIDRCFGAVASGGCNDSADPARRPRLKFILLENGSGVSDTEYPRSEGGDVVGPTVYGHATAEGAVAVAAVPAADPSTAEAYSSRGPALHLFGPVEGTGPAPDLVPPRTIQSPTIAATDCVRTTFFFPVKGQPSLFRFCGTSAAAPHAAAVAALALQANPGLGPTQLAAGMGATARSVGSESTETVGAGLVDARRLIEELALPPRLTIDSGPKAVDRNRRPTFAFSANRPVEFRCELDGSAPFPCTSPFTPEQALHDGAHGFAVIGVDISGRIGASPVLGFRVDTVPPGTFFAKHPRHHLRTRARRARAAFRFGSNEPGAAFVCRVDTGLFRFCRARISRRFAPGRHSVRVKAVDPVGNVDPTPAVFRFEVRRVGRRRHSRSSDRCLRTTSWPRKSRARRAAALPSTTGLPRLKPSSCVPK
jgi:subtilisin family serine protease